MKISVFFNPKCSKSQKLLHILESYPIEVSARNYLTDPLDREELRQLRTELQEPIQNWIRWSDSRLGELGIDQNDLCSDDDFFNLLESYPWALQRPVAVCSGEFAIIARPPEKIIPLVENFFKSHS